MKIKPIHFLSRILLIVLLLNAAVWARTARYVTSGGTDTYANSTNPLTPMSWATMIANVTAGDDVWVKGSISRTTSFDGLTNAGTAASPIIITGYGTTIGDGYLGRNNGNGSLITTNFATVSYTSGNFSPAKANLILRNLVLTGTSASGTVLGVSSGPTTVIECSITNTGNNASSKAMTDNQNATSVINCDLTCATGDAINSSGFNSSYLSNRISASGGNGINLTSNLATIVGNTFLPCAIGVKIGAANSSAAIIVQNTFYGQTTACVQVLNSASATLRTTIVGNMMTDSAYAVKSLYQPTGDLPITRYYNRTRDNTSADTGFTEWPSIGEVTTDTGGPETDYVNAAGNDFRLISTSPAKGAGVPAYIDIGACQFQDQTRVFILQVP